jgi:tRNA/rRNA methyltransferase
MSEIVFVLVEPRTAENVGAAARALKTMGFTTLRLVNPCEYLSGAAQWLAHGSQELLTQAQVFNDLASAIADCDLKIGTTAKLRHQRYSVLTPDAVKQTILEKNATLARVAVVFGREDTGLSNQETDLCDLLSTVPLAQPQPSINLAQAVMIYAYALSRNEQQQRYSSSSDANEWQALRDKALALLTQKNISDPKIEQWLIERLPLLTDRDVRLLHRLLNKLSV